MLKLTQDELKRQLHYDPDSGIFTWLVSNANRIKIGDIAGCKRKDGYICIRINSKLYTSHRLAWLYEYGYLPENGIDHINRKRHDNRIMNLREVSQFCNMRNCSISKNNTSEVVGVYWCEERNKWKASITVNYKTIYLGRFKSKINAVKARWEAEVQYGFPSCNTTSTAYQYLNNPHKYISVPPEQNIEYDTSKAVQDIPNLVA